MKNLIPLIACLLFIPLGARAQVFILNDNVFQGRLSNIKTVVLDSLSNEPVPFASVYVIPVKDTTITNFTLTNAEGEATLEEVPYGNYVFHIEMMGYKPFIKERYFRQEEVDLGTILLQQDEQFLQAATITDVGNPIVVKRDTVEFNASSFRVGANAMLKDLLKRMPGMEITADGKVKFNGEEIDKLTVGGRTFFFNDQSAALNNLPAAVVDKIRVIDRESEETRASGIQDGNREKVLDVALKKEYEKGWFGNVGLKGGATLGKKGDEDLRDNRGFLYNGNVLASAYSEKDQITLIGNVQNIDDSGMAIMFTDEDGEERTSWDQGLSTAAQAGINANTSRIKDVESTAGVNYKYTDTDSGTKTFRTTYQDDGNLTSNSVNRGKAFDNSVNGNLEFQKEKGKVWFHVRPTLSFSKQFGTKGSSSETSREGDFVNRSENASQSSSLSREAGFTGDITFRELWGKENRTLRLRMYTSFDNTTGDSQESSSLTTVAGTDLRQMTYNTQFLNRRITGGIGYTEPFGKKFTLSLSANLYRYRRDNLRDAFDEAGKNDYYSSQTLSSSWEQVYEVTGQYKFTDKTWLTLGGTVSGILNETYSKSYGIEETTGKGEWNWLVTPQFRFQYSNDLDRIQLAASGSSYRPAVSRMLPVLNITNPSRLSVGNVYLKPYSTTYISASWNRNNRKRFSNLMAYLSGDIKANPITTAQWYDKEGVLYAIPVNSRRPTITLLQFGNYSTPLDSKKNWSLTLYESINYSYSTSYQASTSLPGLDKDTFDYSDFMADFWGNSQGDRFYGGQSGFKESLTNSWNLSGDVHLQYNFDQGSVGGTVWASGRVARYSLDPKANLNTFNMSFSVDASYITKHEFEFETDFGYAFYRGYAPGYGQPEWHWNAAISKNIGAFNLSLTVHDILNQTRNLTHTVTDNYQEDTYRLVMGRYILFGVKWNFGKMNAAHSSRAQAAALNMIF
jgi:hypothetical protein